VANPTAVAAKGKGYPALVKRARAIGGRYSLGAAKVDRTLKLFVDILRKFKCGATFPITATEFAIHGLFHVDYSQLSRNEQRKHSYLGPQTA
jgi:hypothetical protein